MFGTVGEAISAADSIEDKYELMAVQNRGVVRQLRRQFAGQQPYGLEIVR